jgi:hypothetical protein
MSNKIDFKTKIVTKYKKGHYIMIKGSIHPEDIIIINIDASNNRFPKCTKHKVTELKK